MKRFLFIIMLCFITVTIFGQSRPTLAILPFTGGSSGDGDTIAELFSFDQTLNNAFAPIPRTSISAAIQKEHNFQMASGMTDPETIARLGQQLRARYILAGSITRLGNQRLLVISIMQIENLQQIAGDWRTYSNISEIRGYLPDMVKNIVAATQVNTSRLQKLAVLPFQTPSGDLEADALAQILAIEIIRTGMYAVFPRTRTLEQVQAEYRTQLKGNTSDEYAISISRGDNPLLALSGAARRLGQERMFNAAIIDVESGVQIKGESVEYQIIEESFNAIRTLASNLTKPSAETRVSNYQALVNAVRDIDRPVEGNYTIILTGNISRGQNDPNIHFTSNARKTITIRGDTTIRTLRTSIHFGSGITLILASNLQLNEATVYPVRGGSLRMETGSSMNICTVSIQGGVFSMNSGTIIGGTVQVLENSTFTMNGGTISGGENPSVYLDKGTFTLYSGTISGNINVGVYVENGIFTMNGGNISKNSRGGVRILGGTFNMNNGTISSNTTNDHGGGVYVGNGIFTMNGGTISGNTANGYGGGVCVLATGSGIFVKTGGTITTDNRALGVLGHNVVSGFYKFKRNTAAEPSVRLDSRVAGVAGGWE